MCMYVTNTKMSLNVTPRKWNANDPQESPKDSILLSDLEDDQFPSSADIFRRKVESQSKFRTQWESIIKKYSAYDEQDQGDLIDLRSGRLIEDRGHLRSLAETPAQSIWDKFFNDERERRRESGREESKRGEREEGKQGRDRLVVLTPKSKNPPLSFATPKTPPPHHDPLCILGGKDNKVSELRRSFSQNLRMKSLPKAENQMEAPRTPTRGGDPLIFLTPSVASTPKSSRRGTICDSLSGPNSRPSTLKRLLVERRRGVISTPTKSKGADISFKSDGESVEELYSGSWDGDSPAGDIVTSNDETKKVNAHDKKENTENESIEVIDLTSDTESSKDESESSRNITIGERIQDKPRADSPNRRILEAENHNTTNEIDSTHEFDDTTINTTKEIQTSEEESINTTKEVETSEDEYFSAAEKAVPVQNDTIVYTQYLNRKKLACSFENCRFKTTSETAMNAHRIKSHAHETTDSSSDETEFSMKDSVITDFIHQISAFPKLSPKQGDKRISPIRKADRKRKTSAFTH